MPRDEPVSPELALVDPELAARLRAAMKVELTVGTRPPAVSCPVVPVKATWPGARKAFARRGAAPLAHAATAVLAILLVLLPFLAFLPPRQGPSIASSYVPDDGMTLSWPGYPRATYYAVNLLRKDRRVLFALPTAPTVTLPPSLGKGSYSWYVYAGFGPIDLNNRRGPIAQGSLSVGAD